MFEPPLAVPNERRGDESRGLSRLVAWWPYVLVAALYLLTSPFHNGLNNPNEMVRVYMTKAAVDGHTFTIDGVIREWGGVDDKAIRDGKLYSSKAPLQSLVGIPVYAAARAADVELDKRHLTWLLRVFGSALPSIGFAWILMGFMRSRAIALGVSARMANSTGIAICLGTMMYPYALTYTGHALAAIAAGGCHLALMALARGQTGTAKWRGLALLLGLAAGAAPFAEYPAALMAAPALVAAIFVIPRRRIPELVLLCALGGALSFGIGLWSHHELWGSPFKTGYSFLENKTYAESHHGSGFFGVKGPKAVAFFGSLFSPATGLFFYSPILILGLVAILRSIVRPGQRALAWAALAGFTAEVLFISGHSHWRGGWTLGPRYIISVAPVLGVWVLEAAKTPRLGAWVSPLGALSVLFTGFAAALYPHLSDVYSNPLSTFVWPSYLKGYSTYGVAHSLGLEGHASNLPHLALLSIALVFVAGARSKWGELAITLLSVSILAYLGSLVPEHDVSAAARENERLWGFWEPAHRPTRAMFDTRTQVSAISVESELEGRRRPCVRVAPERCSYGDQPWHHFGPELINVDGAQHPLMFLHPIHDQVVRARISAPPAAKNGLLRMALSDESVASDNKDPVRVQAFDGPTKFFDDEIGTQRGFTEVSVTRTSSGPITLELRCGRDGARVFGFELVLSN